MNRLVRFGPFLNEELWIGTDDMSAPGAGAWPKNVNVARVEATHSMGERVSY